MYEPEGASYEVFPSAITGKGRRGESRAALDAQWGSICARTSATVIAKGSWFADDGWVDLDRWRDAAI